MSRSDLLYTGANRDLRCGVSWGALGWVRPCRALAVSHTLVGGSLRVRGGEVSLLLNEEKNWGSTGGQSITPANTGGVGWPGNELSPLCAL